MKKGVVLIEQTNIKIFMLSKALYEYNNILIKMLISLRGGINIEKEALKFIWDHRKYAYFLEEKQKNKDTHLMIFKDIKPQ